MPHCLKGCVALTHVVWKIASILYRPQHVSCVVALLPLNMHYVDWNTCIFPVRPFLQYDGNTKSYGFDIEAAEVQKCSLLKQLFISESSDAAWVLVTRDVTNACMHLLKIVRDTCQIAFFCFGGQFIAVYLICGCSFNCYAWSMRYLVHRDKRKIVFKYRHWIAF